MSEAIVSGPMGLSSEERGPRGGDYAVTLLLLAMMLIPVLEIVLRSAFRFGIRGSTTIVQNLTLVISMVGAALAARDRRLLSMATGEFLTGRLAAAARMFAAVVAVVATGFFTAQSMRFVLTERESADILVYGIPRWAVQAVLPLGFLVVMLRILWHASDRARGRIAAGAIAAAVAAFYVLHPVSPATLLFPTIAVLLLAAAAGAPIFVVLGGIAMVLFWRAEVPLEVMSVNHYSLVVNPSLPALPLFTLTGYLLAEGGASKRLVEVFQRVFAPMRGGTTIVAALACAFFTTFTGGSGVTILAMGGLLFPLLLTARYSDKAALGLITGAGSLGILFPPCLPLILYSIVAGVQMEKMFLGGILPGMLLVALTVWWGRRQEASKAERPAFDAALAWKAVWVAKWELLLPPFVLVALFGGFATPVEAAALTALYAFVVETFVYRDYRGVRPLVKAVSESGLLIGGVLLILGLALSLTNYFVDAQIPDHAVVWATESIRSPLVFLLVLNGFLIVVGCLMDIFSAIVVVVPLIVPIGAAFGIDPIHLGIIFLANLELGFLTPPVGMNLFISSYRFKRPMPEVYRAALPMMLVLLAGVIAITYLPLLTTWLPELVE